MDKNILVANKLFSIRPFGMPDIYVVSTSLEGAIEKFKSMHPKASLESIKMISFTLIV